MEHMYLWFPIHSHAHTCTHTQSYHYHPVVRAALIGFYQMEISEKIHAQRLLSEILCLVEGGRERARYVERT